MHSHWNTARGRKPDHRRYTVVEGETLVALGVNQRKRLRSAPTEDVEYSGRPNPEGARSVTDLSNYEEEGVGEWSLCRRCQIIKLDLNRQALALADPASLKVFSAEYNRRRALVSTGREHCSWIRCP
ncbi:hypothetical protein UPYG_G00276690 [Umbra pygmaea]|uniref:Uncharacterized protein n=1 Tax=Umbra pygmaea TaxID=75934 RepID=A0ABD0WN46_UMBPY